MPVEFSPRSLREVAKLHTPRPPSRITLLAYQVAFNSERLTARKIHIDDDVDSGLGTLRRQQANPPRAEVRSATRQSPTSSVDDDVFVERNPRAITSFLKHHVANRRLLKHIIMF